MAALITSEFNNSNDNILKNVVILITIRKKIKK